MLRTWTIPGAVRGSGATKIHCVLGEDPARIVMSGDIDLLVTPALESVLQALAAQPAASAITDLRPATILSCAGVRFLYELAGQCARRRGRLEVLVVPGPVTRILDVLGMDESATMIRFP
ncbi:MAG: anti-sigma factor antagonist [Cryptosporangiaceae bacterium]|nr:anti-sigma factor antagonist [Cryptosporangiaceae bacterium]